MKKKHELSALQSTQLNMSNKKKQQKSNLGKQKHSSCNGRPQKKQKRSDGPVVGSDALGQHQRIQDLRRSLGMSSRETDHDHHSGPQPIQENGTSRKDTEGLDRLVKAAKRGHISMMEDMESSAGGRRKRKVSPEREAVGKRRRASDSDGDDDSVDDDTEMAYEQVPRSFPAVRDLLPIKTKKGVVRRKMLLRKEEVAAEESPEESPEQQAEDDEPDQAAETSSGDAVKSVVTVYAERRTKIDTAKLRIGLLSRAVLESPQQKYDNVHHLLELLSEADPTVMVTVCKYAAASLLEVFKDLLPSYKLLEHDMTEKLKKETIVQYKYENAMIKGYKKYLIKLEEYTKGLSSDQPQLKSLASFCLGMLCQCLVRFRDFNFASNLVSALVPFTSHSDDTVRATVSATMRSVFTEDRSAERTLDVVRKLHQLIKAKEWDCRRDITDLFLALPIRHANLDKERQAEANAKKFMTYKEKLKNMSRNERKRSKKLEALERELMATRAEENKGDKLRRHSDILTVVFTVYFKILKQMPRSGLMASVLEGLAKFAHMINIDFFHDLVESFHVLLAGRCLTSTRQVLLCVQTVFTMLSGQGEAINIDPQRFYAHCYRALNDISLDDGSDELKIALDSLQVMLIKRRKKISPQRVLSFAKRLCSLALRAPHPAAAAALVMIRAIFMVHSGTSRLLDTESVASGLYRPDVDDPEYCGAGNTLLYELTALRRSYHQSVRTLAAHLMLSCPAQGDFAMASTLRQQSPTDVLKTFDTSQMRFTPAVTPPSVVKKRAKRSRQSAAGGEPDWLTARLAATRPDSPLADVDFAHHLLPAS